MKFESIYYSYKNKDSKYYLTGNEEEKLFLARNKLIQNLSEEQLTLFAQLESQYDRYKDALIKEIIQYTITYNE